MVAGGTPDPVPGLPAGEDIAPAAEGTEKVAAGPDDEEEDAAALAPPAPADPALERVLPLPAPAQGLPAPVPQAAAAPTEDRIPPEITIAAPAGPATPRRAAGDDNGPGREKAGKAGQPGRATIPQADAPQSGPRQDSAAPAALPMMAPMVSAATAPDIGADLRDLKKPADPAPPAASAGAPALTASALPGLLPVPMPAATPAEAPRLAPRTAPAEQVAPVAIALALGGPDGRIAISLDPVELGRVEVVVERSGEATHVQVAAERPETLALLARDGAALDRALGGAGIGEGGRSLGFSLLSDSGAGGGNAFPGGGSTGGGGQRSGRRPGGSWAGESIAAEQAGPGRRAVLGLLDIAI
nr:flagellar hook-length control protein FliK [Pararoseomonas indoligenes]